VQDSAGMDGGGVMIEPQITDAYQLFHEGVLALSQVESNGMRVDVPLLDKTISDVTAEIQTLTSELKQDKVWQVWKRRFGEKAKLGSRPQMAKVLFEDMGIQSSGETRLGHRPKMDVGVLDTIDLPFVKSFQKLEKRKKLLSTYLNGLRREVVDGYVHPSYNLHLVKSFRSSASEPNIQNQIVRDAEAAEILRKCFIPRPGCVLTESDYSALEFKIAACVWKDKGMVEYASDPTKDIHRDVAMRCYMLNQKQWDKSSRYCAKNKFVFPQLYGSDYIACSKNLWDAIGELKLKTKDKEVDLLEHLQSNGIKWLGKRDRELTPVRGTFEYHIRNVEQTFHRWFPEWVEAKEEWVSLYKQRGWFPLVTGFRCYGLYSRNELYNYPIQGAAFHCLLWSLIQLVKELKRAKMKAKVVGEIHDSILGDVPKAEVPDYFAMVKEIMENKVRKHWDWIIVPLVMEPEICEENWWSKKAWTVTV
jgi:DNA polymerase-1